MSDAVVDHGEHFKNARSRLLHHLSDLAWHSCDELPVVAGVRYGARVLELKRLGYVIETTYIDDVKKVYRLTSLERGLPQGKRVKILLPEEDAVALLEGATTDAARDAITVGLATFRARREML